MPSLFPDLEHGGSDDPQQYSHLRWYARSAAMASIFRMIGWIKEITEAFQLNQNQSQCSQMIQVYLLSMSDAPNRIKVRSENTSFYILSSALRIGKSAYVQNDRP